ncbi:MAG: roadblock/LC7 domain-containing protein [Acidobacteriota bacterium]
MEITNFKLEADAYRKILRILSSLCENSKVESVFLINRNGQEIARHGEAASLDVQALASLAASNLAAALGLTSLVGETDLERVYQRGERFGVLVTPAGEYALLLLVIEVKNERTLDARNLKQAVLVLADILSKCTQRVEVTEEF